MKNKQILIRPIITEKSMIDAARGVYTFVVGKKAKKPEIKRAIKEHFNVEALGVKIIVIKGKVRLAGRLRKKTKASDFKKALVKIKEGQKIEIFETGK